MGRLSLQAFTVGGRGDTDHVLPVPDVAEDVPLQAAQVDVGLQGEVNLQTEPAAHSQEQQQLGVTEGPRAQVHAVRQVLCAEEEGHNTAVSQGLGLATSTPRRCSVFRGQRFTCCLPSPPCFSVCFVCILLSGFILFTVLFCVEHFVKLVFLKSVIK